MIERAYIDELIQRNDIEQVIAEYVTLKRTGNRYVGLCPFHNEKTPSFSVNAAGQFFHCFGCGVGGNVISFVQQYKNVGFIEAVGVLAERAGMKLPDETDEGAKRRRAIYSANKDAARYFYDMLMSEAGRGARRYVLERGLDKDTVTRFGLGYSPDSFDSLLLHLNSLGHSNDVLEQAGLAKRGSRGHFSFFRNRLMFPIIDLQGGVLGFGARLLEGTGPKYINTADTPVFTKGKHLFALNMAKREKEKTYMLCEGYMDVIALHRAGFKTAVAALGTALTAEQAKLLSVYAQKVVLCYDTDDAGIKATDRATGIFAHVPIQLSVLNMQGAKDPDEYIKAYGSDKFAGLLKNSSNTVEYALANVKKRSFTDSDEGRALYLKNAVDVLINMPLSPTEREVYAGRLEQETGVSKAAILSQINALGRAKLRRKKQEDFKDTFSPYGFGNKANAANTQTLQIVNKEQKLVASLLLNPTLFSVVGDRLDRYEFCEQTLAQAFKLAKSYYDVGTPAEYAVIAGSLDSKDTRELAATMARFQDVVPDKKDIEMYIDGLVFSAQKDGGDMPLDELSGYLEKLKQRKSGGDSHHD